MFRFFLPIFPVGAYFFVQVAREFLQDGRSISSGRICSALALLLILLAYVNLSASRSIQGRTARSEVELARYWAEVGSWIKGQVSPETTLGAAAVGAVPFRSGLRTLDLLGLTDRTIGRFGKTYTEASLGHMRYHTDHVLEQKPGIVLFPPRVDKLAHYSTRDAISKVYAYALFDLVGDPRTLELYEYRTATMPHGEVIEFLQLRAQARR
jgi:hypothetical protein